MTDLTSHSAGELAAMIRARDVSSRDVVAAHLERIAAVNGDLHAVVRVDADRALVTAREADDALARGEDVGPLHGVPFTVKDWIEAEGLICAAGFAERKAFVPKRDATAVARMRAAGAILLGKTNVNDGSPVYERPNNPHDPTRSPGGSSSGEAAIVAARGSPCGLGSDSGGSIRLPAAWCGAAGLKPTNGRVPLTGHFPRIYAGHDPRTTIGPIARTADDLWLLLSVVAGPDGRDPSALPVALGDIDAVDVASLRCAVYIEHPGASPAADVVGAVRGAVRSLAEAGAAVEEATPPRLDESLSLTTTYWSRAESLSMSEWRPSHPSRLSADEIERHIFEWDRFRRDMLRFMQRYDVILCPAVEEVAPPHRAITGEDFVYTLPWSLTGYPAAVVPAGVSGGGMPLSVQIVAGPWRDDVALAVARVLDGALSASADAR